MPLKPDVREAELDGLLHQLRDQLAERCVEDVLFDPRDPMFAAYQTTAWVELERKLFVARRAPLGWTGFKLTPRGWLVSVMVNEGNPAPQPVKERIHQLVKILKGHCDREAIDPVRTSLEQISTECDVPAGWVRNAIMSRMVLYVVEDKHMDVSCEETTVVIGAGFGQPRL